jgi:hypothetical protein
MVGLRASHSTIVMEVDCPRRNLRYSLSMEEQKHQFQVCVEFVGENESVNGSRLRYHYERGVGILRPREGLRRVLAAGTWIAGGGLFRGGRVRTLSWRSSISASGSTECGSTGNGRWAVGPRCVGHSHPIFARTSWPGTRGTWAWF